MNARPTFLALSAIGLLAGCGNGTIGRMTMMPGGDDDNTSGSDAGKQGEFDASINLCGDTEPSCASYGFGPPMQMFALQSDPKPDPGELDQGLNRDQMGWLGLDSTHGVFQYIWSANTDDWSRGTVSKIDGKKVQEVARYFTVTCFSNPGGSKQSCDGIAGCCSRDDYPGFQNRLQNKPSGPHQAVQTMTNYPSRTAVDFNGDIWVSNRAFGGQSAVTKIANNLTDCIDRNKNGKIDTSSDVNKDGLIETDCNNNGTPDDFDDVKNAPCTNGMPQEFYGLDDECILFTTNTNLKDKWGRPLALGRGSIDFGPSDAWAGGYNGGDFFRIDGTTGLTKQAAKLPSSCSPYGAAIDSTGILWAPNLSEGLCFFDTGNVSVTAKVHTPGNMQQQGYGISLDRDQNVWTAGYPNGWAFRYTPDRSQGTTRLDQGFWTGFQTPGASMGASGAGRGIAADSRSKNEYFVWMARDGGFITRIDASAFPPPKGMDVVVNASNMPAVHVAGTQTIGCGVDNDQNLWGISNSGSVATKVLVNAMGVMTAPDIVSAPKPQMMCPAGDRCPLKDATKSSPDPYTYSDFTGFGLRNFTNPHGNYSLVMKGCNMADTKWIKVNYDALVPPNTTLVMHARTGKTPMPDKSWGPWTSDYTMSPADFFKGMPLAPNGAKAGADYLQIEFQFQSNDKMSSPKLKDIQVFYECSNMIG